MEGMNDAIKLGFDCRFGMLKLDVKVFIVVLLTKFELVGKALGVGRGLECIRKFILSLGIG